jgi:CXXX repeat modification system protein
MYETIKLCEISEQELKEIEKLFKKRLALVEMAKDIKKDDSEIYEKIVDDLGTVELSINLWWEKIHLANNIRPNPGTRLKIDFKTREILATVLKVESKKDDFEVF